MSHTYDRFFAEPSFPIIIDSNRHCCFPLVVYVWAKTWVIVTQKYVIELVVFPLLVKVWTKTWVNAQTNSYFINIEDKSNFKRDPKKRIREGICFIGSRKDWNNFFVFLENTKSLHQPQLQQWIKNIIFTLFLNYKITCQFENIVLEF